MTETLTLTPQMGTVFAILAFAIYLFVFEIVRVDVAALLGGSLLLPWTAAPRSSPLSR